MSLNLSNLAAIAQKPAFLWGAGIAAVGAGVLALNVYLGGWGSDDEGCCYGSFAFTTGEKYVVSAWVMEKGNERKVGYQNVAIEIDFDGNTETFLPAGANIDGWQRIWGEFVATSPKYEIRLVNSSGDEVYFDDIRVFPFKGNMKSYVYDPLTLRLEAQLDDNNFATRYEYDEEGALVRIDQETERGWFTIQESIQSTQKKAAGGDQ